MFHDDLFANECWKCLLQEYDIIMLPKLRNHGLPSTVRVFVQIRLASNSTIFPFSRGLPIGINCLELMLIRRGKSGNFPESLPSRKYLQQSVPALKSQ
jgi:hypothetical protein